MRSLLLVLATVVLIVCGFVLYSMLHDSGSASRRAREEKVAGPTSIPVAPDDGSTTKPLVGAGSGAWVRQFDEKTARLKSQFKADRYEPQPDGTTVDVEKPVAEFMLGTNGLEGAGGFVRIEGDKGKVIMPASPVPEAGGRGGAKPAAPAPPTRGQLHDVVISLFDRVVDGQTPAVPSLVVTMNNASFDNDTFLIATEAFDDPVTGRRVEADEVPVKVRGRDYDFDGRGLRIQWNSLSERLQLLEIAHGESLTVKNRATFDAMRGSTTKPAEQSSTTAPSSRRRRAGPTTTPANPTTKPATPYRASFEKDLVITEGDVEIASGSLMLVDFMLEPRKPDEPADDAKKEPDQPNKSRNKHPATGPTTGPTTAPATQSIAEQLPIVVRWSGRMRVMPLEKSDDEALGPEDQIVRLSGTPLKLRREGSTIEAAGATFRTADGSASLRSSDEVPRVTLRNADGAVISTPALAYSEDGGSAVLTGPSRADIPMGSEAARENLAATWNDECRLTLTKNDRGESVIRTATLAGNVAIAHPRMDLNSQTLDLAFTGPTTQPVTSDGSATTKPVASVDLEKMVATGNVSAKLKDPATGAPPRSVQAQRLEMQTQATGDGQLLPRKIIADDRVLLAEAAQSMRAEHLEAILAPKPPPAPDEDDPESADVTADPATQPTSAPTTRKAGDMPELIVESLVAQGNVRLDGEDGAYATAEQLIADARNSQSEIKLQGVSTPAVVSDGKNTITGPLLKFRPQDQSAEVPGPGTLRFTPEPKDGKSPAPVDVAWTGHAQLDGKTNLVDLHQGVSFKTIDADGMTTTTDAQHLQIVLVDRPTTRPTTNATTEPATTPTTRRSTGGLGDLADTNFLADKEPRSVKLTGEVKVSSTLLNDNGEILRRLYMESPEANYDLPSRKMIVPVPGRLLYEDHRPPEAQSDDENTGPGGNRGTTAFAWKKQLTYDDAAQQATMEGDVDINHVPDAQGGESFRIATQRVIAEMEPKPPTTKPTTEPSAATQPASKPIKPAGLDTAVRLKGVIAEGGVNVKTRRFQFTARRLTYSPTTGILTAHSAPGDPITLTDEQGQVDSAIESLTWNTRTDRVSIKGGRGRVRP